MSAIASLPDDSTAGRIIGFGRLLKDHGFSVSIPCVIDACLGAAKVGLENPRDFKTVLQAAFMSRVEERPAFERLFREFWMSGAVPESVPPQDEGESETGASATDSGSGEDSMVVAEAGVSESQEKAAWDARPLVMYSAVEVLREKDFRDIPEEESRHVDLLIREILSPLFRRAGVRRRSVPSGMALDFRRMLRKSLRYGGEVIEFPRLGPKPRLKKLVFLCDVSGSMNPYLRFILRFIREIQNLPTRVETFVFATKLTRITPIVRRMPFSMALSEIARTAKDWSGGTRIGACLEQFTTAHGAAMLRPSTVVIIHSDGWDRGEPELLARQLEIIRRRAYRVLWINPLLGGPSYEPTCRGMSTAIPHLDGFLPGHNINGLGTLAGTLRALL